MSLSCCIIYNIQKFARSISANASSRQHLLNILSSNRVPEDILKTAVLLKEWIGLSLVGEWIGMIRVYSQHHKDVMV